MFVEGTGIIEIGAQWIHGEVSNPVHELACKHGLVHQIKGIIDLVMFGFIYDTNAFSNFIIQLYALLEAKYLLPEIFLNVSY